MTAPGKKQMALSRAFEIYKETISTGQITLADITFGRIRIIRQILNGQVKPSNYEAAFEPLTKEKIAEMIAIVAMGESFA